MGDAPTSSAAHGALAAFGSLAAVVAVVGAAGVTPAPPGLLYAAASVLAGFAAWRLAHRRLGAPWGVLVRGAGLAGGAWFTVGAMVEPWSRLAAAAGLLVLGLALVEASHAEGRGWVRALAFAAALPALALAVTDLLAFQPFLAAGAGRLHGLVAGVAGVLALTRLAALFAKRGTRFHAFARGPARNALATAIFLGYLLYRPVVAASVGHVRVFEWTAALALLAFAAWLLRRRLADRAVPHPWESAAERHSQEAHPRFDPAALALARASRTYVDTGGDRDRYEALWRDAYARAGLDANPLRRALEGVNRTARPRSRRARRERAHAHDLVLEPFRTGDPK